MTSLRRAALAFALAAGLNGAALAADPARTLRVVPQSDLTVLDPMFGTAWISLISGEMIWESLFTWDSQLQPQPMMVDTWTTAPDGLTWRFTLRAGLRFHTGEPVTPADVIASTRRWMALDPVGAKVGAALAELSADGDRTVVFRFNRPFPALLHALAAAPARFPAIMRAKDIEKDGQLILSQVSNAVGSGPFRWKADEQVSGSLAVWERNPDYVPRTEKPDGLAGARVVGVDRVEWHIIPDAAPAAAALVAGEVDMLERPVLDQVELLARQPGIQIVTLTPVQAQNMLRANATIPPFDNPKMRLALAYVIDQADEMAAGWGDPSHWRTCNAYFICGTRNGTEAGAEGFHQDFARARQLAQEAGYKGEPLVFVATKEIPTLGQMSEVAYDALKRAGFNVEMRWADWGTVGALLRKHDGWNLFLTGAPGAMMFDPLTNIATDMSCDGKNFVGWACDPRAEELRSAVMNASDADQPALLDTYVRYLAKVQPYRVLGQYDALTAVRSNVTGLLQSPVLAYWNIRKTP